MLKTGHQHLKLVTNINCLQHPSSTAMLPMKIGSFYTWENTTSILAMRWKLQNQKCHCLKQYHSKMNEKISKIIKFSISLVLLFQIYFWSTYDNSHSDRHLRQNLTKKSQAVSPATKTNVGVLPVANKIPTVPPTAAKSPVVLPTVKKKAVLLISRYRIQFINIVNGMPNILNTFLLWTVFRGGSSFTGNIFNKQKDLVYYFEPFALYGYGDRKFMNDKTQLINQTLHCNPPLYDTAPRENDLNETFVANDIR